MADGDQVPDRPSHPNPLMPDFTITLTDRHISKLNVTVARYNAEQGTALTLAEWLQLHNVEIAIQEELAAEHATLAAQAEQDVAAAVRVARERLIAGLPTQETPPAK